MTNEDATKLHCHALMQFSGEDLDPRSVSRLIGLKPRSSKRRGDLLGPIRLGRPPPLARRGGISYSTYPTVASDDINDHLRYLLTAVMPAADQLKGLVDSNRLRWSIVLFIDDPLSDWRSLLEKSIIETLGNLGIELVLDDPSTVTFVMET